MTLSGHEPRDLMDDHAITSAGFRELLETVPDALVIVDRAGRIRLINQRAEVLFGYTRDALLGQPVEVLVPARFRAAHRGYHAHYLTAPTPQPMDQGWAIYSRHKDGRELPVEIRLSVLELEGELLIISSIRDISDRAQATRVAVEAAVRTHDELYAFVFHDLKNLLTVIKGQAHLLQQGRRPAGISGMAVAPIAERAKQIEQTASRMDSELRRLLALIHQQAGAPSGGHRDRLDLVALARRIGASYQQMTAHHHIRIIAPERELVGFGDAAGLQRVVENILTNAIKYSPQGGEITIGVTAEQGEGGIWAVLTVADQGVGIPAADLPQIFAPFHRARNVAGQIAGDGLGLAIVRQIVEQHGGTVSVTSEEGVGTTCTVQLPWG